MEINFNPKKNVKITDYLNSYIFDNILIKNLKGISIRRKIVKNWYEIPLFKLGIKKELTLKLTNKTSKSFITLKDYNAFWYTKQAQKLFFENVLKTKFQITKNYIEFLWHGKQIKLFYDSEKQFYNSTFLIKEQFFEEEYAWLDVNNNVVVDIGANVGDTAIYFSLKGAKHIYAYEPYPYSYKIALKNINLNNLKNVVSILNEGCGKGQTILIDEMYENNIATNIKNFKSGKTIKLETLDNIVTRFKIKDAVLKLDCEGSEYDVILTASEYSLRSFKQIIIEYHYGYKNLLEKLKNSGFEVKIRRPTFHLENDRTIKNLQRGILYCKRIPKRVN